MAAAAGRSTVHGTNDNEKRWVVFGIVLNKVLVDQVRSFVESEVKREYDNLKTSHAVDTQSTSGRLKKWQAVLKYENINGNDALPKKHGKYDYSAFDCKVTSHVDFAKLYVENFMAKFNAFNEHCDASAVLSLLGQVPIFSAAVQSAAGDVRQARNSWAHCSFSDWHSVKFRQSFDEMEQLVKGLGLPAADEAKLLADLKDWETKGTLFCMNAPVDPALLHLVQQHVNALKTDVDRMAFEVEDDRKEVKKALQDVKALLDELEKRVSRVEQDVKHIQQRVDQMEEKMSCDTPQISWEIANCDNDITFFAERHHPATRQWLFDDFNKWFCDPGDSRAYVLLGDAGVGKSVIAGALAQRTRKAERLGAAYFCRYNDGTRNDPRYLLGTVACQLCNCNSQYNNMVGGEGGVRMMLSNLKLGVQELFTKLLEEPLAKCTPLRERKLVIIDALDETGYESREDFLKLIKERFPRLPDWLVFFITSRPEDTIQSRLERYNPCVRICAGDNEQHNFYKQHEQDIRRFLENGVDFSGLPYSVEEITKKCNGLFLYAFYIKKDLSVQGRSSRRDQTSDLFPEDVKDFFRENFQRVYNKVGADLYERLIGCVLAAPSPLPVSFIPFILMKEKSTLGEQDVIDAVLQFSLNQTANDTVSFLHKLIPTWLTKKQEERRNQKRARKIRKDCPHLLIDEKKAGEYLKTFFSEILFATVDGSSPLLSFIDVDLQGYVARVAPRFLCQHGNKDSLDVVFRCLTNYQFLETRIQSGRMEIYHLLEDLKLAANCSTFEDEHKRNVLREISLALESNVHILLECPDLVHVCLLNASNTAKENFLIPHVSGPWLDCSVFDPSRIADISGFKFYGTSSDKKIVAGKKDRSVIFVDASTLEISCGPFEVSQDTIDFVRHLEFSSDDRYVFFGRLDKWLSVKGGCLEDLPQFGGNSMIYDWGVLIPDEQCIVVRKDALDFPGTCQDKCCVRDLLALWAVKEIEKSPNDNTIRLRLLEHEIKTTSIGIITRFLVSLRLDAARFHVMAVPYDPTCYYCGRIRELTELTREPTLAAVRQLVVELYPYLFHYQVWNLQNGIPLLRDVFSMGGHLSAFSYGCHVSNAFVRGIYAGCSGADKASSLCNIAVLNAACAFDEYLSFRSRLHLPIRFLEAIPKGFEDLFPRDISFCNSSSNKWLVQKTKRSPVLRSCDLLVTSRLHEQQRLKRYVTDAKYFTFTNDEHHFVYSSGRGSLHALCLQTGRVFTSVSGSNLFYFTGERQAGYLFQSGTEKRAIFLTNLFSPFKFLSLSSVANIQAVGKFITTVFCSSDTLIKSVSRDSSVFLCHNTDQGVSFISESSMAGCHQQALQNCVLSPNGRLTACHRGNEVGLYIFDAESEEVPCIIYEQDHSFTVVFAFSADSSLLHLCIQESMEKPHVYLWDVEKKVRSAPFKSPGLLNIECFCISPGGEKLILCGEYEIEIWEYTKQLPCRLLVRTGVERSYNSVKFSQCAVSSNGELLVCCIANTVILFSLWVPDILSSKRVLRGHLGRIEFCKFLKVNRYLITYGVDGLVFLWDLSEAKAVTFVRIAQSQENIVSMAVSLDEDRVICFTSCGRVCVIALRGLENALPSKCLAAPTKGKVDTTAAIISQQDETFTPTSDSLTSTTEDEEFSSSDSEGDMYYYLEHEDVDEFD